MDRNEITWKTHNYFPHHLFSPWMASLQRHLCYRMSDSHVSFFNERIRRNIWPLTSCLMTACRGIFLHLVKRIPNLFFPIFLFSQSTHMCWRLWTLSRGSGSHAWSQSPSAAGEWRGAHAGGSLGDRALDPQHNKKRVLQVLQQTVTQ